MALKFIELIAPTSSDIDIDFLVIVRLENNGTEPVTGVTGELELGGGLVPLEATEQVRRIESIPGGGSKRMTWAVLPVEPGKPELKVKVTYDGGEVQHKSVEVEIKQSRGN